MTDHDFPMQQLDARTPVLVGVASLSERTEDPRDSRDALALMTDAARSAVADAAIQTHTLDEVIVPQGMWPYRNPAAAIRESLKADSASTTLMHIGILQQTAFSRAVQSIADGANRAVLIAGGEAQFRQRQAQKKGMELKDTPPPVAMESVPDTALAPRDELILPLEVERGLVFPVSMYAMIENAFCYRRRLDMSQRVREIDSLWSTMSSVAHDNPDAWQGTALSPDEIRTQPNIATPYTRAHVSQWNVNQASAFVLCSVELAKTLDCDPRRWIFPLGSAEYNHMQAFSTRAEVDRCHGIEFAAPKALEMANLAAADVNYWELYSCFPVAVRLQQDVLNLTEDAVPTVTGGMSFAGGPLNNYSFQGLARMVTLLRQEGGCGAVSSVSGILHKYGMGVWSSTPPRAPYSHAETASPGQGNSARKLVHQYSGEGIIVSSTLIFERDEARRVIALVDTKKARARTIATSDDPRVIALARVSDLIPTRVTIREDGTLQLIL